MNDITKKTLNKTFFYVFWVSLAILSSSINKYYETAFGSVLYLVVYCLYTGWVAGGAWGNYRIKKAQYIERNK